MNPAGLRTQGADGDGTHTYEYDDLYRLKETLNPVREVFSFDANGNRKSRVIGIDSITNYQYDAGDQLTCSWGGLPTPECPAGSLNYSYDDNGNQTDRGSDTLVYDHENRLTQTVIGGTTSTSIYSGHGLRMSHTVGAQTSNYTWDTAAGLPVVLQDGTSTYVYGLDLISATDSAGAQTYFVYDGLGSTTALTDGLGATTQTYRYQVFGQIYNPTGSNPNYWLFTGEQRDASENLYHLRARNYDPESGRFLSRDPAPSPNAYPYVGNDPVNFADPSGYCRIEVRMKKLPDNFPALAQSTLGHVLSGDLGLPYHAYIYTYDPMDKSEKAFRGGPISGVFRPDRLGRSAIGLGSEDILVEGDAYEPGFKDYPQGGDHPSKLILDDGGSCTVWRDQFTTTGEQINAAKMNYNAVRFNSNSVVTTLLEEAGLPVAHPSRTFMGKIEHGGDYWVPGWGENLLD